MSRYIARRLVLLIPMLLGITVVAFTFIKDQAATLDGSPKGCSAVYRPPHELDAQTMTILSAIPYDQHDLSPELEQAASVLANVIEMKCPG